MASARQKKKQLKTQTMRQLSIKVAELEALNTQIENVEKEIEKAKKILKRKRVEKSIQRKELQAIQRELKRQHSIALKAHYLQSIKTNNLQSVRITPQYDEHSQKEEVGALIAKYHDYIDRGIIKPRSFVDNYDQASWMSSILSEPEMKKVLKQADKWMAMSAEKRAQRLANEPIIDF